jgi:hypothetical protein
MNISKAPVRQSAALVPPQIPAPVEPERDDHRSRQCSNRTAAVGDVSDMRSQESAARRNRAMDPPGRTTVRPGAEGRRNQ